MRCFLAYREADGRDFNGLPWLETTTEAEWRKDAAELLQHGFRDVTPFAVENFCWDGSPFSWEDVQANKLNCAGQIA